MDPSVDYFEVLGVAADAGQEELRSAYLRRMRSVHPDLSGADTAHAETVALNEAWEVLSIRRAEYEEQRESWIENHASTPVLTPALVDFGRLVPGVRSKVHRVEVSVEGPRPTQFRILEDEGAFWSLVSYSTPPEEDSPVVLNLEIDAFVPSSIAPGELVDRAEIIAFGVNAGEVELRADVTPSATPPAGAAPAAGSSGDSSEWSGISRVARRRMREKKRRRRKIIAGVFVVVAVADAMLFIDRHGRAPLERDGANGIEAFAANSPAAGGVPFLAGPGRFVLDPSASSGQAPGIVSVSCGTVGPANPTVFAPGFVGDVSPSSNIGLPAGSSQYFYVGDDAGGDPMTAVSWPSDLSVLGRATGSTSVSIGRSLTRDGGFDSATGTGVSIAGIGVSGYTATPRASLAIPAGTTGVLRLYNPWNDVVLVVVGGTGTGLFNVEGAPLQTLVNVTYQECGSSALASAGIFAGSLRPGNYTISIASTPDSSRRQAALGAVAYTLVR